MWWFVTRAKSERQASLEDKVETRDGTMTLRAEYPGSGGDYKLTLKVMDHDTFSSDDFLGQTLIYLEDLLALGVENGSYEMHTTKYRLEGADGNYTGDIKVGVKFTSMTNYVENDEEFGGWKDSEYE